MHSFPLCAQSSSYSGYVRGPHFPDARCAGEGCSASPNDKEGTGIRFGSGYGAALTVVELYTTFFFQHDVQHAEKYDCMHTQERQLMLSEVAHGKRLR